MTPVDERPALVLARVRDEQRRRQLVLMASAIEGPGLRPPSGWWLLGVLGVIAAFCAA